MQNLKWLTVALVIVTTPAMAQQVAPQPQDPQIQALMSKLSDEIQADLQWRAAAIQAQMKVKELEAEVAKLQAAAPKK